MKKIISVVLIAVLTVMLSVGLQGAKAYRTDGNAQVGSPGPDNFCECVHTSLGTADDCMAGLAMTAYYDSANPYNYNYGSWEFLAETSYNWKTPTWSIYQSPYCSASVNQYGYYAGIAGFYDTNSPYWNTYGSVTVSCYYPSDPNYPTNFNPDATSVNGQSYAAFYQNSNHNNMVYVSAQPPSAYYKVMTASPPPVTTPGWYYPY